MVSKLYLSELHPCVKRASTVKIVCSQNLHYATSRLDAASAQRRQISSTGKTRQHLAPTMEQLRAPFIQKNNSTLCVFLEVCQCQPLKFKATTLSASSLGRWHCHMARYPCTRWSVRPGICLHKASLIRRARSANRPVGAVNLSKHPSIRMPKIPQLDLRL